METKYLVIKGGGVMELRNGNEELPHGSVTEVADALAVFRLKYIHGQGLTIEAIKNRLDTVVYKPLGS